MHSQCLILLVSALAYWLTLYPTPPSLAPVDCQILLQLPVYPSLPVPPSPFPNCTLLTHYHSHDHHEHLILDGIQQSGYAAVLSLLVLPDHYDQVQYATHHHQLLVLWHTTRTTPHNLTHWHNLWHALHPLLHQLLYSNSNQHTM